MGFFEVKCCLDDCLADRTLSFDNMTLISDLRHQLSAYFCISSDSFDLVYLGSHMRDDQLLTDFYFNDHPVIYMLNSSHNPLYKEVKIDEETFNGGLKALKKILSNKTARNIVSKKLQNQKLLECIIKAVPEFGKDPIAISILTNKDLLWSMLTKKNIKKDKLITEHPSLARAVLFLVEALKNDKDNLNKPSSSQNLKLEFQDARSLYSLDHMTDDEEDEDEEQEGRSRIDQSRPSQPNWEGLFNHQAAFSQNSAQASTSSTMQPLITSDYFRQAMMLANSDTNPTQWFPQSLQLPSQNPSEQSTPTTAMPSNLESQLQQLREMGITDDAVARRILEETDGNIQLAIEMLFGNEF